MSVTAPALPAGVVAVICVPLTTTTLLARPTKHHHRSSSKFVPVIVTAVPPVVNPVFSDTPPTVGDD